MNIFLTVCKKCGKHYDIGINYEICPDCRLEKMNDKKEESK